MKIPSSGQVAGLGLLAMALAVLLSGCASLGGVTLCGDVGGKPVTVTVGAAERAALEVGQEAKVTLRLGVGVGCAKAAQEAGWLEAGLVPGTAYVPISGARIRYGDGTEGRLNTATACNPCAAGGEPDLTMMSCRYGASWSAGALGAHSDRFQTYLAEDCLNRTARWARPEDLVMVDCKPTKCEVMDAYYTQDRRVYPPVFSPPVVEPPIEPPVPPVVVEPPVVEPPPVVPPAACDAQEVADALYDRLTDASRPGRQAILDAVRATADFCAEPRPVEVPVADLAKAIAALLPTTCQPEPLSEECRQAGQVLAGWQGFTVLGPGRQRWAAIAARCLGATP